MALDSLMVPGWASKGPNSELLIAICNNGQDIQKTISMVWGTFPYLFGPKKKSLFPAADMSWSSFLASLQCFWQWGKGMLPAPPEAWGIYLDTGCLEPLPSKASWCKQAPLWNETPGITHVTTRSSTLHPRPPYSQPWCCCVSGWYKRQTVFLLFYVSDKIT